MTKIKYIIPFVTSMFLMITITACLEQTPLIWDSKNIDLQIAEYMELNSDMYSEFYEMTVSTGFVHLLRARGPYTLLLPTNEAMTDYYKDLGISSLNDMSTDEMNKLIRNHLFALEIPSASIGLGALSDTNALGDFIATEFKGSEIYLAKESRIINRDIQNANGLIHVIDKTLHPVSKNVYQVLYDQSEYSIFTEGLEKTGIREILETVSGPYGNKIVRHWYTVLAVPNAIYTDSSITSVDELILKYDDGVGQITDPENGFYKYMEYHCLGGVYYLTDIISGAYAIISRENQIKIDVDTSYKINFNEVDSSFSSFIIEETNITAKNGVIHPVSSLLPAIDPIPTQIVIQTTDYPDLRGEDCYLNYSKNFTDGENQFAKIKWEGDYLQYYFKTGQDYIDQDCISMSQGYWWLEFTLPKIPKGKYKVSGYFKMGPNRANLISYIDGVKTLQVIECRGDYIYTILEIGEVDWQETAEHTIKFKTIYPGTIYFDRFIFDPTY